jgi:restriction endonuclease S subunit
MTDYLEVFSSIILLCSAAQCCTIPAKTFLLPKKYFFIFILYLALEKYMIIICQSLNGSVQFVQKILLENLPQKDTRTISTFIMKSPTSLDTSITS